MRQMEQSLPDPALAPGEHRCPGPGYRDLVRRDRTGVPAELLEESYTFLGDEPVPLSRYTSAEFAALEYERVWSRTWQWVCRLEHIPEPGDFQVYDIGARSIIVVRQADSSIRAFDNFCQHRGTQLKPSGQQGTANRFTCPYHGWTWNTAGTLVALPCRWDFPHVRDDEVALPEVRVDTWGGFVFINLDPAAPPLHEYLGVLPRHFATWDLADRYVEVHVRKRLPANWKAATEAFLEAYHVFKTHSQALPATGDANAAYDVFAPHVSRFMHTTGTQSPHIAAERSEQEILDFLLGRRFAGRDDMPTVGPDETARDVYARIIQASLGERYGNDFSHLTVAETIDSIEYFAFPNTFFFRGLQFPMVYRFLPSAHSVDECTFELLFLRHPPADGPLPPPAQPVDIGIADSYASVPGMDPGLGFVYDQDTDNLAAQTRGFYGSARGAQQLGNYQEVRARHLHHTIDAYLAMGPIRR